MRVLSFTYTYRTLENFYPALNKLAADGISVAIVALPVEDDPSARRLADVDHLILHRPIRAANDYAALSLDELGSIVNDAIDVFQPTHIVVDCILNHPSRSIYDLVKKRPGDRPVVVAMQQGLFQLWRVYEANFACDHMLCYGEYARRRMPESFHHRLHPVGLPKLDRVADIQPVNGEHILFLGGMLPRVEIIGMALRELEAELGRPIHIKPHPQHVHFYDALHDEFAFEDSNADPIDLIASAGMVVTNGSTSSLEAMLMRKPLAILPTLKSSDFVDIWSCVANDYSGFWLRHAFDAWRHHPDLAERYLQDAIGGRTLNSVDRFIATLTRLRPV